jgi:hypothetical protein
MANIDIKLSSDIIRQLNSGTETSTLTDDLSLFFQADYQFAATRNAYSSYSLNGSQLQVNFADGASANYAGVALADPNAPSGTASAATVNEYLPSYYRIGFSGRLDYDYSLGSDIHLTGNGGHIASATLQTLLPTSSPYYDSTLGNVTMGIQGDVNVSTEGHISGVVTALTGKADHNLVSSNLTGNFNIDGDYGFIGQGMSQLTVSGTATGYSESYTDGSSVSLTGIAIPVSAGTLINSVLLSDANNLPADDVINVALGATPTSPWTVASGAGNDKVTVKGGGSGLSVDAGTGNDTITLGDDGHSVDGGAGADTVFLNGARAAHTVAKTAAGYTVQGAGGADVLTNVERLHFSDGMVGLDIDGTGGQAYRLYQAAYNRAPDAAGLGYWIKAMDAGQSLTDVANNFMQGREFQAMYGANQNNAQFVDSLYQNVLHRAGDQAGIDYWLGDLNAGRITRAGVLADFGESGENKAALIGVIGNGFGYTEYLG